MTLFQTLQALKDNDGLTLKDYKPIVYKTGYQVATEGVELKDAYHAMVAIVRYGGNCGVWLSNGTWYIDKSHRESTLKRALEVGRRFKQLTILRWRDMSLIDC